MLYVDLKCSLWLEVTIYKTREPHGIAVIDFTIIIQYQINTLDKAFL